MIRYAKAPVVIVGLFFAALTTGCATTQQQGEQQENGDNLENNQAEGNFQGDNENNHNHEDGNHDHGNEEGNQEGSGEMVNNVGNEDFSANNSSLNGGDEGYMNAEGDTPLENGGDMMSNEDSNMMMNDGSNMMANDGSNMLVNDASNMGVDAPLDTGEAVNNAVETDSYGEFPADNATAVPMTDAAVNSVVDQAAAAPMDAMPGAAAPMPSGAGVVRYVIEGGTQMYQDSTGQSLVRNLDQGEHPLVYENGEWARTSDGYYIPANGLTSRPVGRVKGVAPWQ